MPRVRPREEHLPVAIYLRGARDRRARRGAAHGARHAALAAAHHHPAIDVSLSMRASDVLPNRLAAAQAAAKEFIREQPGDVRLGIVSFAGTAAVVQQATKNKRRPPRGHGPPAARPPHGDRQRHHRRARRAFPGRRHRRRIVRRECLEPQSEAADVRSRRRRASSPCRRDPIPNAAIILLTDGRRTIGPDPLAGSAPRRRPRRAHVHRRLRQRAPARRCRSRATRST